MEDKVILKEAIRKRGTTQRAVGERIGLKPNSMSMNMTRDRMSVDTFRRILNAMDYDVAVVDRKTKKVMWTVDE